jgi:hypothetical protein
MSAWTYRSSNGKAAPKASKFLKNQLHVLAWRKAHGSIRIQMYPGRGAKFSKGLALQPSCTKPAGGYNGLRTSRRFNGPLKRR